MMWFLKRRDSERARIDAALRSGQDALAASVSLLEKSNRVMQTIDDAAGAWQDASPIDTSHGRELLDQVRADVRRIVEDLIALSDQDHGAAERRVSAIDDKIARNITEPSPAGALHDVLERVEPIALLDASDPAFGADSCRTLRDIAYYVHEMATAEMFAAAQALAERTKCSVRMEGRIPLPIDIVYLDQPLPRYLRGKRAGDERLAVGPMKAFWDGVLHEGWPSHAPRTSVGGFMSVLATSISTPQAMNFAESSFAILGKEYMNVSLRMGYHTTTVEAACSAEPARNHLRMQYMDGGASLDRRIRRIALIADILAGVGFKSTLRQDYLDTVVARLDAKTTRDRLHLLGRLTMMTKQLDMALSNDGIAHWYAEDFAKKLGLAEPDGKAS